MTTARQVLDWIAAVEETIEAAHWARLDFSVVSVGRAVL